MITKESNIVLTGAAGFIGSYLLGFLNRQGYRNIIIVDEFGEADKEPNYRSKEFIAKVERAELFEWLQQNQLPVHLVFHLGARTDTTEFDYAVHEKLNLQYSKDIWQYCAKQHIPLVYASSAATYGSGELGYKDDHELPFQLKPLNPYGVSKNEFDKWALQQQENSPPHWYGLKFFNVYGPNEYHKSRMASVIFHSFNQVKATGKVKLFKSHRPGFKDGQQLRDFIYVADVANVCYWLMQHTAPSGLYNLGTGKARSFEDLANATFAGMGKEPVIEYIDMPEDIRDKYQYFTEADMTKLQQAGYTAPFFSLEEGVLDYVTNYLLPGRYYE
ncbi:MAG TPA: ADP-glyceromanno-heptose 6-epimerase [Chitinophagaceae bacterium]|nr:ADP-glyceromanno-heptose 6-epimerase [Chitinophagaceae bacterium]